MWSIALKNRTFNAENRLKRRFSEKGGPSDRIRTCGILLPKQARYQLRYTRLLSFLSGWSYSPKPGAIPTSLYPDIQFLPLYHGGEENQRFFCLWSFMWSNPLLYRFQQSKKIPQTQVSQGFAAFHLALSRIPPRHSQSKRATNCANPGFLVIEFCARCGQTCGQAVSLTISACGGSACIVGVSRDCGHGIFRLEGGATRSRTRRDTNFAIPGYY